MSKRNTAKKTLYQAMDIMAMSLTGQPLDACTAIGLEEVVDLIMDGVKDEVDERIAKADRERIEGVSNE